MAPKAARRLFLYLLIGVAVTGISFSMGSQAAEDEAEVQAKALDAAEVKAIEEVVEKYLVDNPEVLVRALRSYQEQQRVAQEEQQRQNLASRQTDLYEDPDAPIVGNPDGDVVMVEFFDYRCPYCKRIANVLQRALKDDGKIRLVMKEFPILGEESVEAAKVSLATVNQGKYEEFHFRLINAPGRVTKKGALALAEEMGLDMDQLEKDAESPEIAAMISKNQQLARSLGITGTPALVVNGQVMPGAVEYPVLKTLIEQARSGAS